MAKKANKVGELAWEIRQLVSDGGVRLEKAVGRAVLLHVSLMRHLPEVKAAAELIRLRNEKYELTPEQDLLVASFTEDAVELYKTLCTLVAHAYKDGVARNLMLVEGLVEKKKGQAN